MRNPNSAETLLVSTLNSEIASIGGFTACVCVSRGPCPTRLELSTPSNTRFCWLEESPAARTAPSSELFFAPAALAALYHSHAELSQLQVVAPVQRQALDALLVNNLAHVLSFRLQSLRTGLDLDDLRHLAHLEFEVDLRGLSDFQPDTGLAEQQSRACRTSPGTRLP